MATNASGQTETVVRDGKSGRVIHVRGAGALKGKLTISKKLDLTKPLSGLTRKKPAKKK
jgi:hypothetical protein